MQKKEHFLKASVLKIRLGRMTSFFEVQACILKLFQFQTLEQLM